MFLPPTPGPANAWRLKTTVCGKCPRWTRSTLPGNQTSHELVCVQERVLPDAM
jgi:hypothetical protein